MGKNWKAMRLLWLVLLLAASFCLSIEAKDGKDKEGAGLMIVNDGDVLLLLRGFDTNNPRTWAFPGGNVERSDSELFITALREAEEEMGTSPKRYALVDTIETKRGKEDKLFTVFIVKIPDEERASLQPVLNEEHTEYRWFEYEEMKKIPNKHPVVDEVVDDHEDDLDAAMELAETTEVPLEPVTLSVNGTLAQYQIGCALLVVLANALFAVIS